MLKLKMTLEINNVLFLTTQNENIKNIDKVIFIWHFLEQCIINLKRISAKEILNLIGDNDE